MVAEAISILPDVLVVCAADVVNPSLLGLPLLFLDVSSSYLLTVAISCSYFRQAIISCLIQKCV